MYSINRRPNCVQRSPVVPTKEYKYQTTPMNVFFVEGSTIASIKYHVFFVKTSVFDITEEN